MKLRSPKIKVYGRLLVEVFRKGKLVDVIPEGPNVVTNTGKVHILKLTSPASFSPAATGISRMEVGDGGCGLAPAVSALFTPVAFTATDVLLRSSILYVVNTQAIVPASDLDTGNRTLKYIATFDSASAIAGNFHFTPRVINEFALKSGASDNVTVALRSTRSIPFDPADAVSVRATWTIGLT